MKKIIVALTFLVLPTLSLASGGEGYPLERAPIDPHNKASLQNGAKLFVNYCMGCCSSTIVWAAIRWNISATIGWPATLV